MDKRIVELARDYAREVHEEELALLRELAVIPAPSHHEKRRAAFVRDWLLTQGAPQESVVIDEANNVILTLSGASHDECAVFSAHTDVVFDDTEELPLHEDETRMYAPGVGDDTANLVGLLMAAKWLLVNKPQLRRDVLIVANSCEEGLGNLEGTKALMSGLEQRGIRVSSFTSFDLYLGQHITEAVGSHRWRVTCKTQGGHSWEDAGAPSAVQAVSKIICGLYALPLPEGAKTSVNAGIVRGGTGVNAIASRAEALIEYRSASEENLQLMRKRFEQMVDGLRTPIVDIKLELIGERPASPAADPDGLAELICAGDEAIRDLGGISPSHQQSSTDANVPLSAGIPAHTIGAVAGGLLHTRDEWIDKASLEPGLALILGHILNTQAVL